MSSSSAVQITCKLWSSFI